MNNPTPRDHDPEADAETAWHEPDQTPPGVPDREAEARQRREQKEKPQQSPPLRPGA